MGKLGRTLHRGLFVLGIWIVLAVMVLLLMDRIVMPWLVRKNQQIEVPDVVEMTLFEADSALAAAGLTLMETAQEYDPFIPPGMILSQNPEAGAMVKGKGRWVRVVISKGGGAGDGSKPAGCFTTPGQAAASKVWTRSGSDFLDVHRGFSRKRCYLQRSRVQGRSFPGRGDRSFGQPGICTSHGHRSGFHRPKPGGSRHPGPRHGPKDWPDRLS